MNDDDICFQHILPRLNATDVKFLYEVNTETRKLIKRSSRASDLKRGLKFKRCRRYRLWKFAWEHKSLWWLGWDESSFCHKVAETNKLELLKWAREEKECKWNDGRLMRPQIKVIWKWSSIALQMSVLSDASACEDAAGNGHLEVLKYLREEVKAPWDSENCRLGG